MGIKDLGAFLLKHTNKSIINSTLDKLQDKKVAIDASIFLYKFKYKTDNVIPKFFEQINRLRSNRITPIYIFDGKPPIEKQNVIQKRKQKQIENTKKIDVLKEQLTNISPDNTDEYNDVKKALAKQETKNICVTHKDITDLKYFLDISKINYIQSNGEADLVCSYLCDKGLVDMVMSEDMDILTSNAKLLLRNFNINSNKITIYNLSSILEELSLNYDSWVKLCILFGCDYVKRVHTVGPVYSYNLVKRMNSQEICLTSCNIIDELSKKKNIKIPDNYKDKFDRAYSIFTTKNNILEDSNIHKLEGLSDKIIFEQKDKELLINFLLKNTNITLKKINNRINNIYY